MARGHSDDVGALACAAKPRQRTQRDGVLTDVARFTGNAPREDDQTILVLRLP